MALNAEVVTPTAHVFNGTVKTVVAPGANGQFGVLPGHIPYVTVIKPGALIIEGERGRRIYAVGAGFARVGADSVSLLVTECTARDDLDPSAVADALAKAESTMTRLDTSDPDYAAAALDYERATAQTAALAER